MKSKSAEYDHNLTLEQCDTYTDGVFATLSLINEAMWDSSAKKYRSGVHYEVGRRLTTSSSNKVSPSSAVIPDCTIQTAIDTGIVAELKLGLPKNHAHWEEDYKQILKYDDSLKGWWTANYIKQHDVVALVPLLRAVRFGGNFEKYTSDNHYELKRPTAVIGFSKQSGVNSFMTLKKEWGGLSHHELNSRLREGVSIRLDHLLVNYKERKFVDSSPPMPYLLQIIWDHIFTRYAADAKAEEGSASLTLDITVTKLTQDLQKSFGSVSSGERSPGIPPVKWVKQALDDLVVFKYAQKKSADGYSVNYKRGPGDTLRKFGVLYFRLAQKRAKATSGTPTLPGMETPDS